MSIHVETLSHAGFAPYGSMIQHAPGAVIADAASGFVHEPEATIPTLEWVHLATGVSRPLAVHQLEHHPFSAQTFLPHSTTAYLVVVCPSRADGAPDISGARAFEVPPTVGVTFNAKVWHRSLAPLTAPSAFIMAMMRTGRNDDTVIVDLEAPILIG